MRAAESLNYYASENNSFCDKLVWKIVEPGKLAKANTGFGSYFIRVEPDGKTFQLMFDSGGGPCARFCPTKFTAINRVQWEAEDHYRRFSAPGRLKAPKW
jgi:hypothetical protein